MAILAFVLAGCLENPGVDQGLATKHDRLSAQFTVGYNTLRARLFRSEGKTGLYLYNAGPFDLDTLEFFFQVSEYALPGEQSGEYGYPLLFTEPLAERHIRVIGLNAGSEADLGTLSGLFPEKLDRLETLFYRIRSSPGPDSRPDSAAGFYAGRFTETDSGGRIVTGTLRGLVQGGGLHFWLQRSDGLFGSFRSSVSGDTLAYARYLGGWHADTASRLVLRKSSQDDSIRLRTRMIPQAGIYSAGDTLDFEAVLVRKRPEEWNTRDALP